MKREKQHTQKTKFYLDFYLIRCHRERCAVLIVTTGRVRTTFFSWILLLRKLGIGKFAVNKVYGSILIKFVAFDLIYARRQMSEMFKKIWPVRSVASGDDDNRLLFQTPHTVLFVATQIARSHTREKPLLRKNHSTNSVCSISVFGHCWLLARWRPSKMGAANYACKRSPHTIRIDGKHTAQLTELQINRWFSLFDDTEAFATWCDADEWNWNCCETNNNKIFNYWLLEVYGLSLVCVMAPLVLSLPPSLVLPFTQNFSNYDRTNALEFFDFFMYFSMQSHTFDRTDPNRDEKISQNRKA